MAVAIQKTTINPSGTLVTPSSRYANSTVIYWGSNNIVAFKTYVRKPLAHSGNDKYMVIGAGYEYRPDLVSNLVYGTSDFWWQILEANNIFDVYDFKAGLNIRVPSNPLLRG